MLEDSISSQLFVKLWGKLEKSHFVLSFCKSALFSFCSYYRYFFPSSEQIKLELVFEFCHIIQTVKHVKGNQ